ncbi:hypothetical protein COY90_05445 [Candidatus Roizmanbacteria bacterium CG_4_10_14_0_8_um_filter_39_9]|uniref:Uncharacterized protein n=1 Tax=Candidatus Roizmanbacteria bacterium CG_4_10_14_0_8_um_filter_39_9 TaxID=1974829 RepID=A0A2M7QBD2_9BACT|nr:MAG: hypothetical protein COY90_05445 [Candidatus Roizmanbacteria bacterium CG_4_10_14_0_8_um_filter_39_9]
MKRFISIVIILCAAFLRLWRLPEFAMFLADQGRDAVIARRIITFEHFPAIGPPSSIGQVYLGPFFYYLIAPFLIPLRFDPVGLAYGVAILSIVGLITAFIMLEKTVNFETAIVFLILATFSFNLISFNRFSWNPNLLPFASFMTMYFLYKTIYSKKNNLWYGLLFGAFFGFSFQLHHLAALMAVPIGLIFLYYLAQQKKKRISHVISIGVSLIGFLIISFPLILFDLKHDFINFRNLNSLFTKQNIVAGGSPLTRLLETNQAFWNIALQISLPAIPLFLLSLVIIGLLIFFIRKNKVHPLIVINALNAFSFIYCFSLLSSGRFPHYFGVAYLSMYAVMGYFASFLLKKPVTIVILSFLIVGFLFVNASQYYFIAGPPSDQIKRAEQIANSITPHMSGKLFNLATYPIEFTSEETYIYFLEAQGYHVADRGVSQVTDQMFVLCDRGPCDILHTGSWNINMFGKAKIDTMWEVEGIKIYRLVHE